MAEVVTRFAVRVTPRAGRDEIIGVDLQGELRIRVAAPPVDGRANAAVIRLVADELDVPASAVEIISGASARHKRLEVHGIPGERVRERWPGIAEQG
jgi:uncharacterized protein (TIGR00251 family)